MDGLPPESATIRALVARPKPRDVPAGPASVGDMKKFFGGAAVYTGKE